MKHASFILSILLWAQAASASYSLTNLPDNATIGLFGDSYEKDGDLNTVSSPEQTGCMFPDYITAGLFLLNPSLSNLCVYNFAKSGTLMTDQSTAIAELGYAVFSYNLFHGYGTNNSFNIGIEQATANGSQAAASMLLSISNNFKALALTTNSVANTNEMGTSVSNHVDWVALSDFTPYATDGGGTGAGSEYDRMTAATNGGARFGAGYVNAFDRTFAATTNWIGLGDNPPLEIKSGIKAGHPRALGSAVWTYGFWMETMGTDTNIFNVTVDYNSASIVTTNHCVVTSISKTGNTLTLQVTFLRMAPTRDIAGTVDLIGNVTTNDTSALATVWPAAENFFQEKFAVQNLPAGLFKVYENGILLGIKSNVELANWNMATNYIGDRQKQKTEVLGRVRDLENADRGSLLVSAGNGIVVLGSLAFTDYPTHTGDGLEAQLDAAISGVKTNNTHSFAAVRAEAQPVSYTYQIVPNVTIFAPFRR